MEINWILEAAKPHFEFYIRNMRHPLAKWIQYRGAIERNGKIVLEFGSSGSSIKFDIPVGVISENDYYLLNAHNQEIYGYFRAIKYNIINKVK